MLNSFFGPAGIFSAGVFVKRVGSVVNRHKKQDGNKGKFDKVHNLSAYVLYFISESGSIIATFVRPGKTQQAESGESA